MARLVVTKDIAIRAVLAGACRTPTVGSLVSSFSQSDLVWAEQLFSGEERKSFNIPLWVRSGYGSGYGHGDGYGDGYGDGSGDGYGHGDGSGDGHGHGHGYGHGDGHGYGHGDGYGSGYGSGKDIGAKILAIK